MIMVRSITHFIKYEKLKMQNHFLEMLTATVSHDMRTPLNSILGIGKTLERHVNPGVGLRFLGVMMSSAKILHFLVNDLIDLFRIRNGKFSAVENSVNLKEQLNELLEVFHLQAIEKGLSLQLEYDE